jgi:hypothetical protein
MMIAARKRVNRLKKGLPMKRRTQHYAGRYGRVRYHCRVTPITAPAAIIGHRRGLDEISASS